MAGREMADYYAILEVPYDASQEDIRRAYKSLARVTHPDKNPGPEALAAFQALVNAYDTLHDKGRRREYDAGRTPSHAAAAAAPASSAEVVVRGDDVRLPCTYVDAAALYAGEKLTVRYRVWDRCTKCPPAGRMPCPACAGNRCWKCKNEGTVPKSRGVCGTCGGGTLYRVERTVTIALTGPTVYAATNPMTPLRMRHQGSESPTGTGSRGDLLVIFNIRNLPGYMKIIEGGRCLLATIRLPFMTAMVGGTMVFPNLDGSQVEAVYASGDPSPFYPENRLHIRGLGLPTGLGRGDIYVQGVVEMPKEIGTYARLYADIQAEEEEEGESKPPSRKRAYTETQ